MLGPRSVLLGLAALALVAGGCRQVDGQAPGAVSTTTDAVAAAACTPTVLPGRAAIEVDGGVRDYVLHLPEPTGGERSLVVLLHGHGGSPAQITAGSGLPAAAVAAGHVVVVPSGLGDPSRWNFDGREDGPDDGASLAAVLAELEVTACIDPDRVALVGSSNGAAFAGTQACRAAAVVMVIATVPPDCPARPPSVLTIRGTADATVAYEGTPDLVAELAARTGCAAAPELDVPHPGVERTTYAGCRSGSEVVLVTVGGGVHVWPGGPDAQRRDNSEAGRTFDATSEIVAFLAPRLGPT